MEHSLLIWLLPTLALVAGVAIGFLVARLLPNAVPNRTQRQLYDIQERFDSSKVKWLPTSTPPPTW